MYKPRVQRLPVATCTLRKWTREAEEALRDCFESTDLSVLQNGKDLEEVTQCSTDYLNFCMDVVVPTKTVRCFPNNKPWVTSDVKNLLNNKKRAFRNGDLTELNRVQKGLKECLKGAKESYRKKEESELQANNMKGVWQGLCNITGCGGKSGMANGDMARANQLNNFFNRFDSYAAAASVPHCYHQYIASACITSITPQTSDFSLHSASPPPSPPSNSECSTLTWT